jgi:hypothetical protein
MPQQSVNPGGSDKHLEPVSTRRVTLKSCGEIFADSGPGSHGA